MSKAVEDEIETFIVHIETSLDRYIDIGTEDELFVSGYLHGHFSLVASRALQQPNADIAALKSMLINSLDKAFANNELDQEYQSKVFSMWNKLADIATLG